MPKAKKPRAVSWFVPVLCEVKATGTIEAEEKARALFINPRALVLIGVPFIKGEKYIDWQKKK